jgi:hypothetical protein
MTGVSKVWWRHSPIREYTWPHECFHMLIMNSFNEGLTGTTSNAAITVLSDCFVCRLKRPLSYNASLRCIKHVKWKHNEQFLLSAYFVSKTFPQVTMKFRIVVYTKMCPVKFISFCNITLALCKARYFFSQKQHISVYAVHNVIHKPLETYGLQFRYYPEWCISKTIQWESLMVVSSLASPQPIKFPKYERNDYKY